MQHLLLSSPCPSPLLFSLRPPPMGHATFASDELPEVHTPSTLATSTYNVELAAMNESEVMAKPVDNSPQDVPPKVVERSGAAPARSSRRRSSLTPRRHTFLDKSSAPLQLAPSWPPLNVDTSCISVAATPHPRHSPTHCYNSPASRGCRRLGFLLSLFSIISITP